MASKDWPMTATRNQSLAAVAKAVSAAFLFACRI